MQTFLAYSDFDLAARCLDPSRLGNQAYRECKVLITGGWKHHPASKMWRGFESALARYALACFRELTRRGRNYPHHIAFFETFIRDALVPPWLGDERLHSSHRSALLMKNPTWYSQFGWSESPMVVGVDGKHPYYWPVSL
jgi:hypothetical protein